MDINYFKAILFELLNESNAKEATEIRTDDKNNTFKETVQVVASFAVKVEYTAT